MKNTLNNIIKVLGWIALFVAFASLGFAGDNPQLSVPLYLIFFLIVFGLVYLYIRKNRKQEVNPKTLMLVHKIFGIILVVLGLISPAWVFKNVKFPILTYLIITVISAILIGLAILAIRIINNARHSNAMMVALGYLILVILSVVPALVISPYDSSYSALGKAYYAAILISVFSWWGFSLFTKQAE